MEPRLVRITQDIPGLDGLIGAWVCIGERNIVIDVGPSASVGRLVASLRQMGVDRVDLVLITHIHIDHAGGLAPFLEAFPTARAVCHAKGIRHLVEPSKLWEGSLNTLGDLARSYGPIPPVPQDRLIPHTEVNAEDLRALATPGHAAHHLSFTHGGNLFSGEAAGVCLILERGEYLRPATPPVFFMEETLGSIDRLLALEDQPMYFAHLARSESSHLMLKRAKKQVLLWHDVIRSELSKGTERLVEGCAERLRREDPELQAFRWMAPDEQKREAFFTLNSVKGFLGYLEGKT
jgi:glyoxylase-like metal-dependent hydrolase (beta-lactamase superfamily II)